MTGGGGRDWQDWQVLRLLGRYLGLGSRSVTRARGETLGWMIKNNSQPRSC